MNYRHTRHFNFSVTNNQDAQLMILVFFTVSVLGPVPDSTVGARKFIHLTSVGASAVN